MSPNESRDGALFIAVGSLLAAVGAALLAIKLLQQVEAKDVHWQVDLAGALLGLAGTLFVTGVLGVFISNIRRNEETARKQREHRQHRREEDGRFVEGQVVKLWEARATVKRAAVLIAAHQSAKTYGEQVRTLITVRASVMDNRGAVRRRQHHATRVYILAS